MLKLANFSYTTTSIECSSFYVNYMFFIAWQFSERAEVYTFSENDRDFPSARQQIDKPIYYDTKRLITELTFYNFSGYN